MAADGEQLKFTEAQHLAILSDAVQRETSALIEVRDGLEAQNRQLAEEAESLTRDRDGLAARVEVLEAEKAAEVAGRQKAEHDFAEFEAKLERAREVAARKEERVGQLRAAAPHVPDTYFADAARQDRWAELADEAFATLVEGLTEAARDVSERGSSAPTASELRETAAFTGGTSPGKDEGRSTVRQLMAVTGRLPAAAG